MKSEEINTYSEDIAIQRIGSTVIFSLIVKETVGKSFLFLFPKSPSLVPRVEGIRTRFLG